MHERTWKPAFVVMAVLAATVFATVLGTACRQRTSSVDEGQDGQQATDAGAPVTDEARQKETSRILRNLGNAYLSWLVDQVGAAAAGQQKVYLSTNDSRLLTPDEVTAALRPSDTFYYMDEVSLTDGWGHPIEVWLGKNLLDSRVLLIRSPGRDGSFDGEEYDLGTFPSTDYDRDIVWVDGYFIQFPEGVER